MGDAIFDAVFSLFVVALVMACLAGGFKYGFEVIGPVLMRAIA